MSRKRRRAYDDRRLARAFAFAAKLHADQRRKGTQIPYLSHLMAVAALVQQYGGNEDQVIAALLHDGPEDRGGRRTLRKIRRRFGRRVARIVEDCTDTFKKPKPDWKPRKLTYLKHLKRVRAESLLVSLADKVHNLGCIVRDYEELGDDLWTRFKGDQDDILWYYGSLCKAYTKRSDELPKSLLTRYQRSVKVLHAALESSASRSAG